MSSESARLRWKTWTCCALVILSNVFGNFLLKRGMPASLDGPADYILVLFRPMVSFGVLLLILWLAARMALLSWADLSYIVPVTSIGYVLVAIVGRLLLNEQISNKRWLGIALIMAGVALVSGGTAPHTFQSESRRAGAGQ